MKCESLTNQRIWVTGASSGIGEGLAIRLAAQGNTVIVSARRESSLSALSAQHNNILVCPCDVSIRDSVQEAGQWIEDRIGALDIVVINAGVAEYVEVDAFDAAVFERVMAVNYFGAVYTIEAALPLLRAGNKPYIVGVSSSAAYMALPRAAAYGASKAAFTHTLESLALDLAAGGIDVSVVSPGFIKTSMTDVNDFPMPMLMEVDEAVEALYQGIERRKREIRFPRLFVYGLRMLSKMPVSIRHLIARRLSRS